MPTIEAILEASRQVTQLEAQLHGLANPQLQRGLNTIQDALAQHLPSRAPDERRGRPAKVEA